MTGKGLGRKGRPVNRKAGPKKLTGASGGSARAKAVETAGDSDAFELWLEDKLRTAYSSVLEEPIPEDLLKLLDQKLKD